MPPRIPKSALILPLLAIALCGATTAPTSQPAKKFKITYHLSKGSEKWPADVRNRIVQSMDEAVAIYNKHGEFDKQLTANYSPGTPTADSNYEGWINFGGQINRRVALHEIAHTLGVGTYKTWRQFSKDGKWTGPKAIAQLKQFDGPEAVLHSDRLHFWPYGLNFDNEDKGDAEKRIVFMVAAMRQDMGIINGKP